MAKQVTIDLPEEVSAAAENRARERAKEAAIVSLQQEGELSIRAAARLLGLTYEGYFDLLHQKGLAASNIVDEDDEGYETLLAHAEEIAKARQK